MNTHSGSDMDRLIKDYWKPIAAVVVLVSAVAVLQQQYTFADKRITDLESLTQKQTQDLNKLVNSLSLTSHTVNRLIEEIKKNEKTDKQTDDLIRQLLLEIQKSNRNNK